MGNKEYSVNLNTQEADAKIEVATDMKRTGTVNLNDMILYPNEGLVLRIMK